MDDYYDLLGIDADAPVDDIRAAYREKKAAVGDKADAKSQVAALNKAWNVLSDPYQRGRYDEQRAGPASNGDGDDDEYDDDADDDDGDRKATKAAAPRTRKSSAADRRAARRQPVAPTITLPAGMEFAPARQRVFAMIIDLFILLLLFLASLSLTVSLEKSQHLGAYHRMNKLQNTEIPKAEKAQSAAAKAASALEKQKGKTAPDAVAARAKADALQKQVDALTKHFDRDRKLLAPIQNAVTGGFILLSLLILALPSVRSGQTIGKRLQGIRVVRLDGSRLRLGDAVRRYGSLVLAAYALSLLLQLLGPALVLFGATTWMRNPNRQGLQDRLAKTLVVTA